MVFPIVLSYIQVEPILKGLERHEKEVVTSLDLGITQTTIRLDRDMAIFPDGSSISKKNIQKIYKHDNRCYVIDHGEIEPVIFYSETTEWVRTLYPTRKAPTTLVSGILMHRIKDTNPWEDTRQKIKALEPLKGATLLDTSTGLGYTAIQAALEAYKVVTVEIDPAALELAKMNPWSNSLFHNHKIEQVIGDILLEVTRFNDASFTHILHDPPTLKIAGQLYSHDLYCEFFRILKPKGKLFHYIGNPDSDHGSMVTKGVIERLKGVGFGNIEKVPQAFGVAAVKG